MKSNYLNGLTFGFILVILGLGNVANGAIVTDTSGDVGNTGIDIVLMDVVGNDIVLTMLDTPDVGFGNAFLILISSDLDHNTWEAGIAVIGGGFPAVYWNIGDLCDTEWVLDSAKLRVSGTNLQINFIEFQDLFVSELAVLTIDSTGGHDWALDETSTYADFSVFYSVTGGIFIPSGGAVQCNFAPPPPPQTTDPSPITTTTGSTDPGTTGTTSLNVPSIETSTVNPSTSNSRPSQGSNIESSSDNPLPLPLSLLPILSGILIITITKRLRTR